MRQRRLQQETRGRESAEQSQSARGDAFVVSALEILARRYTQRSEEHTSELQSRLHLVCRLLLEKKKTRLGIPVFLAATLGTAGLGAPLVRAARCALDRGDRLAASVVTARLVSAVLGSALARPHP